MKKEDTKPNNYSIPSLRRGFEIVEAVVQNEDGLTALELEERLHIPKTTVFRILQTLQKEKWLEKRGDSYVAGHRLVKSSMQALSQVKLRSIARPYMEQLSHDTQETSHIGVMTGKKVMLVEVCDGPRHIRVACRAGTVTVPHASSLGKVLLAYEVGSENLENFFAGVELEQRTANTITTIEELKKELDRIKMQGYAVDNLEYHDDVRCLAAPVWNAFGQVVAAVGITATTLTFDLEMVPETAEKVKKIASDISVALGAMQ